MAGFGSFAPTGAAFGTMTPQEEGELPPSILDKIVSVIGGGLGKAAMVPGQALNSPVPLTSGDMVAPATDMAMTLMGGGMPMAERGALGMAGGRLQNFHAGESLKRAPEEVAESIWQSNSGKIKKAMEETSRMKMFAGRVGMTPEEISHIEGLIQEKAKNPFVSQAKLDRMAMEAADATERAVGKR